MQGAHVTDNVIPINGHAHSAQTNEHLIKALSDLLEMAKDGGLQCLVGTGFTKSGDRVSIWGGHYANAYEMIGSLALLEREFADSVTEEDDGQPA
jgi:hypothetical protein